MSLRAFVRIGIGKWLMTYATERHWDTLVKMTGHGKLDRHDNASVRRTTSESQESFNHKSSFLRNVSSISRRELSRASMIACLS